MLSQQPFLIGQLIIGYVRVVAFTIERVCRLMFSSKLSVCWPHVPEKETITMVETPSRSVEEHTIVGRRSRRRKLVRTKTFLGFRYSIYIHEFSLVFFFFSRNNFEIQLSRIFEERKKQIPEY